MAGSLKDQGTPAMYVTVQWSNQSRVIASPTLLSCRVGWLCC
jgi:hypothetical protein